VKSEGKLKLNISSMAMHDKISIFINSVKKADLNIV
jgi:hypothetical protein